MIWIVWLEEAIRSRGGSCVQGLSELSQDPLRLSQRTGRARHPSKRKLKDGDIIGLDLRAIVSGFYGDSAVTVPVGNVRAEALRLIQVTEAAMYWDREGRGR